MPDIRGAPGQIPKRPGRPASGFANRAPTRHIARMFRRRTLLLSAALLPISAAALLPFGPTAKAAPAAAPGVVLSPQDKADIARIEDYLTVSRR